VRIEWLILSDHAVIENGKVYIHGGGWNETFLRDIPSPLIVGVAVSFVVAWNECNIDHTAIIECVDMDGHVLWSGTYNFRMGRSHLLDFGDDQRMQAAWQMALLVPFAGNYAVHIRLGDESWRSTFKVRQG